MGGTRKQKRKVGQKTFSLDLAEVDKIVAASKERALDDSEHKVLETCQQVLTELFLREQRNNEKSKDVLGEDNSTADEAQSGEKKRRKGGNGRHPRKAFTNADDIDVPHPDLKPGDPCPCGCGYKLYALEQSSVFRFLGQAIRYMQNHWTKLTAFLRVAGAPLDNNLAERCLKKVVLHRKNSLFYRTVKGALVGDIYISLIVTCQLNKVDPFDYLTKVQLNAAAAKASPAGWLPWTYKATLEAMELAKLQAAAGA